MSAINCPKCGKLRKVEQNSTPDGWQNPACGHCGDPGWLEPYGDDVLAGYPTRMPPRDEFRCSWRTAQHVTDTDKRSSLWYQQPWLPVLGLPVVCTDEVPDGKLQLWINGEMRKEVDIDGVLGSE